MTDLYPDDGLGLQDVSSPILVEKVWNMILGRMTGWGAALMAWNASKVSMVVARGANVGHGSLRSTSPHPPPHRPGSVPSQSTRNPWHLPDSDFTI